MTFVFCSWTFINFSVQSFDSSWIFGFPSGVHEDLLLGVDYTWQVFVFKLVSWTLNERDSCKIITEKFREIAS